MNLNNFVQDKKVILNLFKERKFNKVIKLGTKLLKKNPNDLNLIYILGLSSINVENFTDAESYFKKLLLLKETSEFYYIYGNILKKLKNYNEAINSFNKAISLNSNFSEAYNNLGNTKKLINKNDEAIDHYQKAISIKDDNIEAHFNLANILKENKKFNEVKLIYEKILKIDKNNVIALNDLGAVNLILGNVKIARKYFEKILKINISHFKSYKNYTSITKIDQKDDIFKKLENVNLDNLSEQNKIYIFSSLSKGYFDQNKSKLGFQYLEKLNKIKIKQSNFSINNQKKLFKSIKDFFHTNNLTNIEHQDKIKSKPIFILGMPRSGTTLLEQILSSHSEIYGAGELNYLPKIIDKVNIKKHENFISIIEIIRSDYYKKIIKLSNKPYIIDKLPMNFRWIGFIIKAFPEAKIIHLERNPMAVCWSNYKTNFVDSGMDFTLSQQNIAEYYALYFDLMKFWFEKFDNKIININYEKFVIDYKKGIKKVIDKLNLNWQDKLKNYNINKRPVETASFLQVRNKIIKNTSEQWKKYQDYLETMQKILKANNIKF